MKWNETRNELLWKLPENTCRNERVFIAVQTRKLCAWHNRWTQFSAVQSLATSKAHARGWIKNIVQQNNNHDDNGDDDDWTKSGLAKRFPCFYQSSFVRASTWLARSLTFSWKSNRPESNYNFMQISARFGVFVRTIDTILDENIKLFSYATPIFHIDGKFLEIHFVFITTNLSQCTNHREQNLMHDPFFKCCTSYSNRSHFKETNKWAEEERAWASIFFIKMWDWVFFGLIFISILFAILDRECWD